MQGDAKVLEFLNQALKNELTSINQYELVVPTDGGERDLVVDLADLVQGG